MTRRGEKGEGEGRKVVRADLVPYPPPYPLTLIVSPTHLHIDGPTSSYCARVWQTSWNSGVEASIEPPNQTAKRCTFEGRG